MSQFGAADAGADDCEDSGDGSGRWIVERIEGFAADSCVYHLRNHPPSVPHRFPHDAWHVNVRFGGTVREYTPVSTHAEWEKGELKLLVKSYSDGVVSKKFAKLRQLTEYGGPQEEQPCWVLVSTPILTLTLPALTETLPAPEPAVAPPLTHLGIVVGGTGVAPALQILRELTDGTADGAFDGGSSATLLYSSRTALDVLCVDELREVEQAAGGRIIIKHTLTDVDGGSQMAVSPAPKKAKQVSTAPKPPSDPQWIPGRHFHFVSKWNPFKPRFGPLRTSGPDAEAGLRGRIDQAMLASELPPPGEGVRVVVCGPPAMWEDMKRALVAIGHREEQLVELKALSELQLNDIAARDGGGGMGVTESDA